MSRQAPTAARRPAARHDNHLALAGAAVQIPPRADAIVRYAAAELARFLWLMTGRPSAITESAPTRVPLIRLAPGRGRLPRGGLPEPAAQAFDLRVETVGRRQQVRIAGPTPVGVLYGVYALLEELGVGFLAGGPTLPDRPADPRLPSGFARRAQPAFKVRGNMLHYNFLCGCTNWGVTDYGFYFDQLARQRGNVLLMHWYDSEPGAAYTVDGGYRAGGVTPNSLTKPWGAIEALRTSQFAFDSGRYFGADIFSSPMGEDQPDLATEIRRTEAAFRTATAYARGVGVGIAAGFELPLGDPTDPAVQRVFEARLTQFVQRNPELAFLALWQREGGACFGTTPPPAGTPAADLLARHEATFAHLGNRRRVWEAVRTVTFADQAVRWLERHAPHLPLVLVGWGGDRWMRFAEACLGFDRLLPDGVIFTCHDNIDASFGPNVSTAWGELPAARERWAMPWVEGDIDECWVRQPHVESLGRLAPDALRKGAQGLLTLQWRTRDVEEETGYALRFAWQPDLTPDRFYRDLAYQQFGSAPVAAMTRLLAELQRLGARWTGVRGTFECGLMRWTGHVPHIPFDLDAAAPAYLRRMAEAAADALEMVPPDDADPESGAYHLRQEPADLASIPRDPTRLGVAEMRAVCARLQALDGCADEARLRAELSAIEEQTWTLRAPLVCYGMSGLSYRTFDIFLIVLHHLLRNAGASRKLPRLQRLRAQLATLRGGLARRQPQRLERLDFLAATMDFVLHYDRAVCLLADGEAIDQALAAAERAVADGQPEQAAAQAAEAYASLVAADLPAAVAALTRKLTTRCDWGVLATFNVKALPLYWQTIARLEGFLPAVPPRELAARGLADAVTLSWEAPKPAAGYQVYRRPARTGRWVRVNRTSLPANCRIFVDRPARPGDYAYCVAAVDDAGREGPRSHVALASTAAEVAPRIAACMPPARAVAGRPLPVDVVIVADREPVKALVVWTRPGCGDEPRTLPLLRAGRERYVAEIPAEWLTPGLVTFHVVARDAAGGTGVWPESAYLGQPWSVVIDEPGQRGG